MIGKTRKEFFIGLIACEIQFYLLIIEKINHFNNIGCKCHFFFTWMLKDNYPKIEYLEACFVQNTGTINILTLKYDPLIAGPRMSDFNPAMDLIKHAGDQSAVSPLHR